MAILIKDWDSDKIKNNLFKYYFSINNNEKEEKCKLFFKEYLRYHNTCINTRGLSQFKLAKRPSTETDIYPGII